MFVIGRKANSIPPSATNSNQLTDKYTIRHVRRHQKALSTMRRNKNKSQFAKRCVRCSLYHTKHSRSAYQLYHVTIRVVYTTCKRSTCDARTHLQHHAYTHTHTHTQSGKENRTMCTCSHFTSSFRLDNLLSVFRSVCSVCVCCVCCVTCSTTSIQFGVMHIFRFSLWRADKRAPDFSAFCVLSLSLFMVVLLLCRPLARIQTRIRAASMRFSDIVTEPILPEISWSCAWEWLTGLCLQVCWLCEAPHRENAISIVFAKLQASLQLE